MVRAYEAFSGPAGDRDPAASRDVQDDQFHLTQEGVDRGVDLLVAGGFAPIG